MKRLFQVNKPNGKVHADDKNGTQYFESKVEAKKARDALNASLPALDFVGRALFAVSPGPDHKGKLPKKSRSHILRNRTHTVVKES